MEKKRFDLLSLGEILLRLSPAGYERIVSGDSLQKQVGGAELNVASGGALLGLRTGIISKVPEHAIGIYAKNRVRYSGVSDDYLIYDREDDARLGIYFYESGAYPRKPSVVYDRRNTSFCKLGPDEFPDEMYRTARCFHTSGITLALDEKTRKTGIEMIRRFKEGGAVISFDVNFRGNLWSGPEAKECIEQILPYVDIFFCSEDTARLTFLKAGDVRSMMKAFAEEYAISYVASTQRTVHSPKVHTFGSVIYSAETERYYEERPYENIEVIDRIGSGDAYISGVLYGLLTHDFDCQRAVEYGNAASAVKNTIPGDQSSSSCDEIERIIENHQAAGEQSEMDR